MKKVFIALSLVAALSLGGCTSVTAQNKEFTSKVVGKVANEKIEITSKDYAYSGDVFLKSPCGVVVDIKNNTDDTISIDWNKSSINYNNQSFNIMLQGQKFIDAGKQMPNSTLPSGMTTSFSVVPAQNVHFSSSGWIIDSMYADKVNVVLNIIDASNNASFYNLEVLIKTKDKVAETTTNSAIKSN